LSLPLVELSGTPATGLTSSTSHQINQSPQLSLPGQAGLNPLRVFPHGHILDPLFAFFRLVFVAGLLEFIA